MVNVRVCYPKKITERFEQNLLFAIIHELILTLYLFKNRILDFIRTKRLEAHKCDSDERLEWIAEEINTVLKLYELEVHDKRNKWEVILFINISDEAPKEKTELLAIKLKEEIPFYDFSQNINQIELKVRTLEDAYLETPVADITATLADANNILLTFDAEQNVTTGESDTGAPGFDAASERENTEQQLTGSGCLIVRLNPIHYN